MARKNKKQKQTKQRLKLSELSPEELRQFYHERALASAESRRKNKEAAEAAARAAEERHQRNVERGKKAYQTRLEKAERDPVYAAEMKRNQERAVRNMLQGKRDKELAEGLYSGKYDVDLTDDGTVTIVDVQTGEAVDMYPRGVTPGKRLEKALEDKTFDREQWYDEVDIEPAEEDERIEETDLVSDKIEGLIEQAQNQEISTFIHEIMSDYISEMGRDAYFKSITENEQALLSIAEKAFTSPYKDEILASVRSLIAMLIPDKVNVNDMSVYMREAQDLLEDSGDFRKMYSRSEYGHYTTYSDGTPRNKKNYT